MTTVGSGSREAFRRYDPKTSSRKAGRNGYGRMKKDLIDDVTSYTLLLSLYRYERYNRLLAGVQYGKSRVQLTQSPFLFTDSYKSRDRRCCPRRKRPPPSERTIKRNVKWLGGPWAVDECRLDNDDDRAPLDLTAEFASDCRQENPRSSLTTSQYNISRHHLWRR